LIFGDDHTLGNELAECFAYGAEPRAEAPLERRYANALTGRQQSAQQIGADRIADGGAQRAMTAAFDGNG
jgi:hypothetical protein